MKTIKDYYRCDPPKNPENGLWNCNKNDNETICFLECGAGYRWSSYLFNNAKQWTKTYYVEIIKL